MIFKGCLFSRSEKWVICVITCPRNWITLWCGAQDNEQLQGIWEMVFENKVGNTAFTKVYNAQRKSFDFKSLWRGVAF